MILAFVIVMPIVSAAWQDDLKNWLSTYIAPATTISVIGFSSTAIGIMMGLLALIMIFAILYDIMGFLPFSKPVQWILTIGFMIGMAILGVVRSIAGWGLTIGSYLVGGAGALSIIASAVIFILVLLAIFIGGNKLIQLATRSRGNRELMDAEVRGYKKAAEKRQLDVEARENARSKP